MSEALFERAQLPRKYWDVTLSRIPDDLKHKSQVVDFIDNLRDNIESGIGLYYWGPYGSGKSAISGIILKAALSKGYMPLWIDPEKIPEYQTSDVYFDEEILMRDRMFDVPLLIVDDLKLRKSDKIKNNDQIERWLEFVIRRRSDRMKSTIVTSNFSPHQLKRISAVHAICTEALLFVEVKGINFRDGEKK